MYVCPAVVVLTLSVCTLYTHFQFVHAALIGLERKIVAKTLFSRFNWNEIESGGRVPSIACP